MNLKGCFNMALPKKKKFLKFSVPKCKTVLVVCKKRHRGFRLGFNLKKNHLFSRLGIAIQTQLYFYLYPMLDLIRAYYQNILFLHKFSLASAFLLKRATYLDYLSGLMFFGAKGLYFIRNYTVISQQFSIKLYSVAKDQGFSLSKTSGVLKFKVNKYADKSCLKLTVSPCNWAVLKQVQPAVELDSRVKIQPNVVSLKKKVGFTGLFTQKVSSIFTKVKSLFTLKKLKSLIFRKGVGHVGTTLTSYIVSLHLETLTPKKIEHNYDSSIEVFAKFFVNIFFFKKVKWKTIFKYYFWTWDPLWRRYRYRIYWLKKAIYKKMNWVMFLYFFKRLGTIQKKKKNKPVKSFIINSIPTNHWTEEGFSLGYLTRIVPQAFVYRFFFKLNLNILKFLDKMAYPEAFQSKKNFISLQESLSYTRLLHLNYDHFYLYPQNVKNITFLIEGKSLKRLKQKTFTNRSKKFPLFNVFKLFKIAQTTPNLNIKKRSMQKSASSLNIIVKNSF